MRHLRCKTTRHLRARGLLSYYCISAQPELPDNSRANLSPSFLHEWTLMIDRFRFKRYLIKRNETQRPGQQCSCLSLTLTVLRIIDYQLYPGYFVSKRVRLL